MNPINGSSAVGYGFNALGTYGPASLTSQVFLQTFTAGQTYTDPNTGTTYSVPDNVVVVNYSPMSGGTRVYTSQYDLQEYLSVSGSISGSYGGFSGEIEASYSSALQEWGSCFYALTNAWIASWSLALKDISLANTTPAFQAIVNGLPSQFDPSKPEPFFEFFYQQGTHYVHDVGVGGYFCYYEAVNNSGSYTQQQVQASVSLEYDAVFASASAQSQADWQKLGQQWVNDRIVTVTAMGGTPASLNNLNPNFGTDAQSSYQAWLDSIARNPSAVQFNLRPWDNLLAPGSPKQIALQNALASYMNWNIYVRANADGMGSGSSEVAVLGSIEPPQVWPANPPARQSGIQITIVDSAALVVNFSKVYYFSDSNGSNAPALFNQIMADMAGVQGNYQYCAIVLFNSPWGVPPDSRLIAWMNQFGITGSQWLANYYNCGGGGISYNYAGLGLYGSGHSEETCSICSQGVPTINELNVNPFVARMGRLKAASAGGSHK